MSDEKFEILEANSDGNQIIYIVDAMNSGNNNQYPEALMKVQDRQGYCLLLDVKNVLYNNAMMYAVFYAQDNDGLWKEVRISAGRLCDYVIVDNGQVLYKDKSLSMLLEEQTAGFKQSMQIEKIRREEEKKRCAKEQKYFQKKGELQVKMKHFNEGFKRIIEADFSQQQKRIIDTAGNRWIKCEFCGLIATESEFISYGGPDHINLGTCSFKKV